MRVAFQGSDLDVPPIPEHLASSLRRLDRWLWSTRDVDRREMYFFEKYPSELFGGGALADYAAVSHGGHGVHSYFLTYQLVAGRIAIFTQAGWGGAYMDEDAARRSVAITSAGTARVLVAADQLLEGDPALEPRFILLFSPDRGVSASGWLEPGASYDDARRWISKNERQASTVFESAVGRTSVTGPS
jgi:hypothetical protein